MLYFNCILAFLSVSMFDCVLVSFPRSAIVSSFKFIIIFSGLQ